MTGKTTAVLKFHCRKAILLVEVSLINGSKWRRVAEQVLRMYRVAARGADYNQHQALRISRLLSPTNELIDLGQRILYYDIKAMAANPAGLTLIAEGPICMLNDGQLLYIHSFLRNSKDSNAMIHVSKRFCKLFSSDEAWRDTPFTLCRWTGSGHAGSDEHIWAQISGDAGLGFIHGHRLRWMSHNTSRLKLIYGSLAVSVWERFFQPGQCSRTVMVLGEQRPRSTTQAFFARLHYLVPESATEYHLKDRSVLPLLRHARLVDIEPSPRDSRSRNHTLDPGTLVERSTGNTHFVYRRLGDPRLTFVGLDLPVDPVRRLTFDYSSYYELTAKTRGNVLLLEYSADTARMLTTLQALWEAVQYHYGATVAAHSAAWERGKLARFEHATTPVLVVLLLDLLHSSPTGLGHGANRSDTPDGMELVPQAVKLVHDRMVALVQQPGCRQQARPWFVQPVDATALPGTLCGGYFAGVNWLLRAMGHQVAV